MKILFVMRNTIYARNFESTLRLLAGRGHQVDIVAERHSLAASNELVERLCRDCPAIRHHLPPVTRFSAWSFFGFELRRAIDYLRYCDPAYAHATKLRNRAERGAPEFAVAATRRPLLGSAPGRWLLARLLHAAGRAVPRDPAIDALVREHAPDLVLVTPLVEPGSPQSEFLRSARALGVRTGLCVYSWDNLTNKGLIQEPLDLVTVWNEAMKQEAVTLHHVPPARVVVTGAVAYDHWFTWQPRESRAAFCARVGLRADRPYLLYLCSSKFIAPDEAPFVRTWVTRVRSASAVLGDAGVLVRPHPQNFKQWSTADLGDLDNVAIWPRTGANPVDDDSRADYYDSIYHSAAVVGVNTSAQIESAIVGRGVFTLLAEEFRETQHGTPHFRHLAQEGSGLLHVAATFDEHAAQLESALRDPVDDGRCRRFVEAFVRPYGVDAAAAPRLVAALEATAARGRARADAGAWWGPLARPALARVAARFANTRLARKERAARRRSFREQRDLERASRQTARAAAKRTATAARARQKHDVQAQREAAVAADGQLAARAYQHYLDVRERVRLMDAAAVRTPLTPGEQQVAASLAHLWDASPEAIATLRRHCAPISGVDASEYDRMAPELKARLGRERRPLSRSVPGDLFVGEPTGLGGFGLKKGEERYNDDTLRYLKVLIALHDGAVLGGFRESSKRRLVWEIGGGWGGFAYQFKTTFPNVTYLITGLPESLLVSAVYLMAMFPAARVRFFSPESPGNTLWRDWESVDFIFAPEHAVPALQPPALDLVVDIMSLRLMSAERVRAHVQRAFDLGARYLYSLLPDAALASEAPKVWTPVEQWYWPHPVPPRVDKMPHVVDLDGAPALESDYAHLIGWRRLRA